MPDFNEQSGILFFLEEDSYSATEDAKFNSPSAV